MIILSNSDLYTGLRHSVVAVAVGMACYCGLSFELGSQTRLVVLHSSCLFMSCKFVVASCERVKAKLAGYH